MAVGMGVLFLVLIMLLLAAESYAFFSAVNMAQQRPNKGKTKISRRSNPGSFVPLYHHHNWNKRQQQRPYRLTTVLYSSSSSSSTNTSVKSANFTQLITNCISQLSYENTRISLVEADSISVIEWLANFFNNNSKVSYEVLLERLSVMEDQQIEIKGAYKSPDIKVIQTLSPLAIAKSLSESRQYVCNCLLQDLQTIEKENEEALALAMVRTRGSHTEYEKAKLRADERMKKPITGTTKQRLRQDVYSFMNNVITSIAFDRYQEDLIASGADEANVKSLYDHIQAILNGTIEDPILKSSGNYNEPEDFRQSSLFHSKSSSAYDNELQLSETATSQQNDVEFSVQELLERLYVHGLVRTHHEEKTKEVAVDIDIYSVVDGVAKNRIDIANDALIIMSD